MEQVIEHGAPDAMLDIQERRKEMTVLKNRSMICDKQINIQTENEHCIDKTTRDMEIKILQLEQEANRKGLDVTQLDDDPLFMKINDPDFIEFRKKKVEKHAIDALQKKFHIKFKEQKDKLEDIILHHNDFMTSLDTREGYKNQAQTKIDITSYPLNQELDQILEKLKGYLPVISSRLPWNTSVSFKSRSTSNSRNTGYIKNNKVLFKNNISYKNHILIDKSKNLNSKSVNDLAVQNRENKRPHPKPLMIQENSTIEILKSNKGSHLNKGLLSKQTHSPFMKNHFEKSVDNSFLNQDLKTPHIVKLNSSPKKPSSGSKK